MKTGNIGNIQNQYTQFQNIPKVDKPGGKHKGFSLAEPIDTYTASAMGAADPAAIEKLWKDTNHAAEAVRKLVQSMLGKQDETGQGFWAIRASGKYTLSETDRAQAQELIGEDGFFGVKQTTARIMDFAKALVGEGADEKRIELMRTAVQKGFNEVARMFGGFDRLPDVTKQTYEAIMKAFDEWIAGSEEDAA